MKFEIRGITLSESNARKFKADYLGQDWIEKLREGFDSMLKDAKKKKMSVKEKHALYKWLYELR